MTSSGAREPRFRSLGTAAAARLARDPRAKWGIALLALLLLTALLAPWLAPHDPTVSLDMARGSRLPPSSAHLLGTDQYGRDVLSRLLFGARTSLAVATAAVLLATTIGTVYGAMAGWAGGWVDAVLMRALDGVTAVPRLLLLVGLLAVRGDVGLFALVVLLGGTGWFAVARLVRGEVRALRDRDFVAAARALGVPPGRMLFHHVLPNAVAPAIVAASLGAGHVVVLEAGLSFLGIGVRPPHPSWGNMLLDAGGVAGGLWWLALFPGLAILATVAAFTLLGDALRDAMDPRHSNG